MLMLKAQDDVDDSAVRAVAGVCGGGWDARAGHTQGPRGAGAADCEFLCVRREHGGRDGVSDGHGLIRTVDGFICAFEQIDGLVLTVCISVSSGRICF